MPKRLKVVVAGAGVGGLTAAFCLQRAGLDVEVFERAPALAEVGAGVQLSPNAMRVLGALGLTPALEAVGFRPEMLELRLGRSGGQVFSVPIRDEAVRRYVAPYLNLHRADLVDVLAQALAERAPGALRLGAAVSGYTRRGAGVEVWLDDGRAVAADVLVGADGVRSRVREAMLGPDAPRFTGHVAWRAMVPADERLRALVPPTACVWTGPGRHAVTYYVRGGELINFVGLVEQAAWVEESWTTPGDPSALAAEFAGWAEPVRAVLAAVEACSRWGLFDRASTPRWTDGPVALLGDACHPMPPFVAQGAAMAIEDGWALAHALASAADPAAGLRAYEAERRPRATRVRALARANARTFHHRSPLAQFAAYAPMWAAVKISPALFHARQQWLYGYDPTRPG